MVCLSDLFKLDQMIVYGHITISFGQFVSLAFQQAIFLNFYHDLGTALSSRVIPLDDHKIYSIYHIQGILYLEVVLRNSYLLILTGPKRILPLIYYGE